MTFIADLTTEFSLDYQNAREENANLPSHRLLIACVKDMVQVLDAEVTKLRAELDLLKKEVTDGADDLSLVYDWMCTTELGDYAEDDEDVLFVAPDSTAYNLKPERTIETVEVTYTDGARAVICG